MEVIKSLEEVERIFEENGYEALTGRPKVHRFVRPDSPLDEYHVKLKKNRIEVKVPIKNGKPYDDVSYRTEFDNFEAVASFLRMHLGYNQ